MMSNEIHPPPLRLALRAKEAAAALGVSERTLRSLLPQIPHFREGGVVLIPVELLREWLRERAKAEPEKVDRAVKEIMASFEDDLQPGD
jgi:excisionase family DNA binding protein